MMKIEQLNDDYAIEIANHWKYPDPYSFYNMTADPEDYEEIICADLRKDHYFQVVNDEGLYGFFALYPVDDTLELGLGIKPEYTGKGEGEAFIRLIMSYIKNNYQVSTIFLSVVDFNIRAQKVYEKIGFKKTRELLQETNGSTYCFIEMKFEL